MRDVTSQNFGLLIAYVLPGLLTLWAVGEVMPSVQTWLIACLSAGTEGGGISSLIGVLLASIAAGMTTSAIRWAIVDRVHSWTGLRRPAWDDSRLHDRLSGFEALVDNHYRHYQFYANMLVAMLLLIVGRSFIASGCQIAWDRFNSAMTLICLVYWATSRDTLRNYYTRAAFLLGTSERMVRDGERTFTRDCSIDKREAGDDNRSKGTESAARENDGSGD